MELVEKKCVPCEGGVKPLSNEEEDYLLKETVSWSVNMEGGE